MKIVRSGLMFLAAAGIAMPSFAGDVNSASVTTFQSGTTLSSQQLNTTINALVTAINDNAAKIAALEAAQSTQPTSPSVAGKSYCAHSIGGGFSIHSPLTDPNNGFVYPLGLNQSTETVGVKFNTDGSGVLSQIASNEKEAFPGSAVSDQSQPLGSQGFTWTLSGNKLVITIGTDVAHLGVSNSGEVIMGGSSEAVPADSGTDTWYLSNHTLAIQVDDVSSCDGIFGN